jgi:glycine betaine/choline ABC-type transport system substrate-binding protein
LKLNAILPIILFAVVLTFICGCQSSTKTITVGSKNFTEQIILGEIISQLVENQTDITVKRKFNLGGTFVCFTALKQGDIDIYPEYTGTGLTAILKREVVNDKNRVFDIVKDEFKKQFDLVWLKPLGLNNTYTITMRTTHSEELSIERISDLVKHQDVLRSGFTSEFLERPDGFEGLRKKYGIRFKIRPKELDPGLMYKAIQEKQIDVICGFATDGRIPAYNLKILQDDNNFFPPYYAAPVIRQKTIDAFPELKTVINKLSGLITDLEMSEMNFSVDQEGKKVQSVARNFLKTIKLL